MEETLEKTTEGLGFPISLSLYLPSPLLLFYSLDVFLSENLTKPSFSLVILTVPRYEINRYSKRASMSLEISCNESSLPFKEVFSRFDRMIERR